MNCEYEEQEKNTKGRRLGVYTGDWATARPEVYSVKFTLGNMLTTRQKSPYHTN